MTTEKTGREKLLEQIDQLPLDSEMRAAMKEGAQNISDEDAKRAAEDIEQGIKDLCLVAEKLSRDKKKQK